MSEARNTARRRSPPGRLLRWAGLVLLLLLAAGVVEYTHWHMFRHRLVSVTPDRVYQSGAIPPAELVSLAEERGIRSVVDLRDAQPEGVAAERAALDAAGITHHHIPCSQAPARATYAAFRAVAADPANLPMLIHCQHGEGRSVLFAAIYRMEQEHWSNREAWRGAARLPASLRFLERIVPGLGSFAPSSPKGRMLLEYRPVNGASERDGGGDRPR